MSTKLVTWLSENCLPCSCKGTVNVIICTIFNQTVPGQIIESTATSGCETGNWKYQIQYDSDDLPPDVTALATTDITGVACEGCLTTWIKEQYAANVVSEVVEVDSFDFSAASNGDSDSIILTILNPSSVQSLTGMLFYNWTLDLISAAAFSAGATSNVTADGVAVPNAVRQGYFAEQTPGGIDIFRSGSSCCMPYTLAPGEEVDFELTLTADIATIPSTSLIISKPQLAFYGITAS